MTRSVAAAIGSLAVILTLATGYSESSPQTRSPSHAAPSADERVDLNTSSLEDLLKIPGMTRTWAARIVRFRPYRAKNDLIDKGVVSNEVYNRIKNYVIAHRTTQ